MKLYSASARYWSYLFVLFILFFVQACTSDVFDSEDRELVKPTNKEEVKRLDIDSASNSAIDSKYPKKYSKFVSYNIDRSYVNSVDYPVSQEAYYASRFTNKKEDITKPPFSVSPITTKIKEVYIEDVIDRINKAGDDLNLIKDELLMIRKKYIEILSMSKYCCSYGLTTRFEHIGVDNDYVFKFMVDDKRLYELQNICMIINDNDIANLLGSVELSVIVRDVRNSCVCKNREILTRQIELFKAIIGKTDLFKRHNIIFKYKNELGEVVKNSIGRDMVNLLNTLEQCP